MGTSRASWAGSSDLAGGTDGDRFREVRRGDDEARVVLIRRWA